MITHPKVLNKLAGITERYYALRFEPLAPIALEMLETTEHYRREPVEVSGWRNVTEGDEWGGDWVTAWFRGDVVVPESLAGKRVFIRSGLGAEILFFVNGVTKGVFDWAHHVVCAQVSGVPGETLHLAFEAYAGHVFPGTQPFDGGVRDRDVFHRVGSVELVTERDDVVAFVAELTVLRQLVECLDNNSLRKHRILRGLERVFAIVDAAPGDRPESVWRAKLADARAVMAPLLALSNGPTMPQYTLVGASHMDTAWLWPIAETWRKCARTFSSALNLMEQYPEMTFLQPAPYHGEVLRQEYPELFARMQEATKAGRWEPNGAMWVEPDANIPSGESFVRQVLEAQRWTREHFDYEGDTLWLPDVFGYSAALPQILQLGRVEFFMTTKMSWNDTTRFPYESFRWRGIDGTEVVANLNLHNEWPDPKRMIEGWNWLQHKDLDDRRLLGYGHGDGGGGVMAEMLEVARRCVDLEGCPRTKHGTLTSFMREIRDEMAGELPVWSGELYLELHRGTLTSIAGIKRGNRKSEFALRDAELLASLVRLAGGDYPATELRELWRELCVNQFHDILPGSSIARVNDEAIVSFASIVERANAIARTAASTLAGGEGPVTQALVVNTLSWERTGEVVLEGLPEGLGPVGGTFQWFTGVDGVRRVAVEASVPALGSALLPLAPTDGHSSGASPFRWDGTTLDTPTVTARFDETGTIVSLYDKALAREVVAEGGALNTLLLGEDIPAAWDNWDIDSDQELKMVPATAAATLEVVGDGPLQFRLRRVQPIGQGSSATQDIVFHAGTSQVDFETVVDWSEKRSLLKSAFDLSPMCDSARHEIQYGHVVRPTHRNLPQDRARFEVCAHKWSDVSEDGFGVALLNDCKYGLSVHGSTLALSLVKGGAHPDPRGDEGTHLMVFSVLPHGTFGVESVIRPAYELNVPVLALGVGAGACAFAAPVALGEAETIVEAVKWADDGDGLIVRLYDAAGSGRERTVAVGDEVRSVGTADTLEEREAPLALTEGRVRFPMHPFEIQTLRLRV